MKLTSSTFNETAHGKVNLGLAVLARRGDGFHELETAMVRIGLADAVDVRVNESARDDVMLEVTEAAELPPSELARGADNLAHLAATRYLSARRQAAPEAQAVTLHVELVKRIPVAAGLGGGSADAGAVLRLLARALPAEVNLGELARGLGSDVPFMLGDANAALAKGRGERLTPLQVPRLDLVLVNPSFAVSAAEGYANLVGFTPRLRFERALERLAAGEEPGWPNALQPGVLRLRPELRGVLARLREAGLRGALMSGSGPTCFGIARDAAHAASVAERLRATEPSWWVRADATL